jgi:alkanesulfonate monooxygenase SsuD/methylene tetrahydromethanopterin reductase-like flavin-dependent oxidoreductase (luciferase family)
MLNTPWQEISHNPEWSSSTDALTTIRQKPKGRVDWNFGTAYGDDAENFASWAINDFIAEDSRIFKRSC